MSSAWVHQDDKQVKKVGTEKASWYVSWYSPGGNRRCKSCGPGYLGQRKAERLKQKVEAELLTGTYQEQAKTTWANFRKEYDDRVLSGLSPRTVEEVVAALNHFQRIIKPARLLGVSTSEIDRFKAARRKEPGKKKGSLTSPATINKELRHLRSALTLAVDWGHLAALPKFRMEKVPLKLPRYIPGEHFSAIYLKCEEAKDPAGLPYPAADWWRALVVTGYMTGWRIGDMLNLQREDVDLDRGTAIIRWEAEGNKGKRDELVKLNPVVVEHLKKLAAFTPTMFPWPHAKTFLYDCFGDIQRKAEIHLPCREKHEHTPACHVYGFHDLRRAFATMNADILTPDALQTLMRHKSYSTTQRYINIARQLDEAVANLHVPDVLKNKPA